MQGSRCNRQVPAPSLKSLCLAGCPIPSALFAERVGYGEPQQKLALKGHAL